MNFINQFNGEYLNKKTGLSTKPVILFSAEPQLKFLKTRFKVWQKISFVLLKNLTSLFGIIHCWGTSPLKRGLLKQSDNSFCSSIPLSGDFAKTLARRRRQLKDFP